MISKAQTPTKNSSMTSDSAIATSPSSSLVPRNSLLQPIYGVLLFGPPGCGKSFLVRSLAKEKELPILTISPSTLLRKYVGETSQLVKATFSLARKLQPCILFVDEMDSLFRARHEDDHAVDRNIKTEFMQLWDQLKDSQRMMSHDEVQTTLSSGTATTITTKATTAPTKSKSKSSTQFPLVMVIGATNRPQDLDAAVQRRFEQSFLIGAPDEADRKAIFKVVLRHTKLSENFDFAACARLTEGFTPSDIVALCKQAVRIPLRAMHSKGINHKNVPPSTNPRPLVLADIEETCSQMYPTAWQAHSFGQMQQNMNNNQQIPPTFDNRYPNNFQDDEEDD
jgi:SpoVK/Ycf46/Vps4 family AAA+-type ATPase